MLTIGQEAEYMKKEIELALNGLIITGESEDGYDAEYAIKEECDEVILRNFDHMVFIAKSLAASGRAMNRLLDELDGTGYNGSMLHRERFNKYMKYVEEENQKFQDYLYEVDKEDLAREAEEVLDEAE